MRRSKSRHAYPPSPQKHATPPTARRDHHRQLDFLTASRHRTTAQFHTIALINKCNKTLCLSPGVYQLIAFFLLITHECNIIDRGVCVCFFSVVMHAAVVRYERAEKTLTGAVCECNCGISLYYSCCKKRRAIQCRYVGFCALWKRYLRKFLRCTYFGNLFVLRVASMMRVTLELCW